MRDDACSLDEQSEMPCSFRSFLKRKKKKTCQVLSESKAASPAMKRSHGM
jgi:hypothetical protein